MARSEARLVVSIWADPDFLALSPTAQRMFMFLISQPDLAHDGVIALRERRWSKSSAGLTAAQVAQDLDELSAARFTLVDEDTEELLIRSFVRRDKVYRQPNVLRAAGDHLATVSSPRIRAAVGAELARIQAEAEDIPEGSKAVIAAMLTAVGNPSPNPSDDPSPKGSGLRPGERGVVTAVSSGSPNPVPQNSPNPVPRGHASRGPREDARKRGTRLPEDFEVTPEMVAWHRENVPQVNGAYETAKFVDYWRAKSGRDATKTDWVGTWRNWMRKASERAGPAPGHGGPRNTTDQRVADALAIGAQLQAEADRKALAP
jgi:hypothetical protein